MPRWPPRACTAYPRMTIVPIPFPSLHYHYTFVIWVASYWHGFMGVLQQLELIQGLGTLLRQQISHEFCSSHDLRGQYRLAVYSTSLSGLSKLPSPCSKFHCWCTLCTLYLPIAGCHKGDILVWLVSSVSTIAILVRNTIVKNSKCSKFWVNHLLTLSNFCFPTNLEQGKA